jgi:unsaturated rhamnogalacturonyl hydrolase
MSTRTYTPIPPTQSSSQVWSVRMADSVMKRNPSLATWDYETGLILKAIAQVWQTTNDSKYYDYIVANYDRWVNSDGSINRHYVFDEYQLDHIAAGKLLFLLYRTTGNEKYNKAIRLLRSQLEKQPRTGEGGFWHKKIHAYQMWLDGIYMACPFCAEYAKTLDEPAGFDDVAKQIILMARHTRDPKTGLFYHGWDEKRVEVWADPVTGHSPHFWGRGLGWYSMGIVDVLDYVPKSHPQRKAVIEIYQNMICAVVKVQDAETGLWYQVLDQGGRAGNYLEASASCMFVCAIAKGVRMGYIDPKYLDAAKRGYAGIIKRFVQVDSAGLVNLNWICRAAAFDNASDGSYQYYISRPIVTNDMKGVGPFILASVEMGK